MEVELKQNGTVKIVLEIKDIFPGFKSPRDEKRNYYEKLKKSNPISFGCAAAASLEAVVTSKSTIQIILPSPYLYYHLKNTERERLCECISKGLSKSHLLLNYRIRKGKGWRGVRNLDTFKGLIRDLFGGLHKKIDEDEDLSNRIAQKAKKEGNHAIYEGRADAPPSTLRLAAYTLDNYFNKSWFKVHKIKPLLTKTNRSLSRLLEDSPQKTSSQKKAVKEIKKQEIIKIDKAVEEILKQY